MPNAKDLDLSRKPLQCLVIGPPKVGKTTFAGTFPQPVLLDFDDGILSLGGCDVEYFTLKQNWRYFPELQRAIAETGRLIREKKRRTIILDSGTTMTGLVFNFCCKEAGVLDENDNLKPGTSQNQIPWIQIQGILQDMFRSLLSLPAHCVCIAHEKEVKVKNEVTAYIPNFAGQLARTVGAYFDEVYYMNARGGTKNSPPTRFLQTRPYGLRLAGSRINGYLTNLGLEQMPEEMPPSYAEFRKYTALLKPKEAGGGGAPVPAPEPEELQATGSAGPEVVI